MKYLSFDIECSAGGKGAICTFGYVIADESFNIVEKRDIVINPEYRFYLVGRRKRPDIQLSYTEEEFKNAPNFPHVYDEIKGLLENPDNCILGYAISNDADFIRKDCVRYNLPCIDFKYFDLQRIVKSTSEEKNELSLENACINHGIDINVELHKSDNDAYLTFQLFKVMVSESKLNALEYLEKYPNCKASLNNYRNRVCDSNNSKKSFIIPNPKGKYNCITNSSINKLFFVRFCRYAYPKNPRSENKPLKGMKICVSDKYERYHFKEMIHFIQFVTELGGHYTYKSSEADIYLTYEDIQGKGRLKYLHKETTILPLNDFLMQYGSSIYEIEKKSPKDIIYLLNDKYSVGGY